MIIHIVNWKLKDNIEEIEKINNAKLVKEKLEALKGKITELVKIEVGINFNESEAAFDLVLYSEFKTKKDLDSYQNHPEHLKVAAFVKSVVEKRVVVDYER